MRRKLPSLATLVVAGAVLLPKFVPNLANGLIDPIDPFTMRFFEQKDASSSRIGEAFEDANIYSIGVPEEVMAERSTFAVSDPQTVQEHLGLRDDVERVARPNAAPVVIPVGYEEKRFLVVPRALQLPDAFNNGIEESRAPDNDYGFRPARSV